MRNLFKWVSKLRLALHLLLFLMITGVSVSQAQPNGEEIFKANCKSCHTIGKGPLIGPDLKDVETRAPDRDWLVKWITNSQELVKAGALLARCAAFTLLLQEVGPAWGQRRQFA